MTTDEYLTALDALLNVPTAPAPLPAPPDMAAALEWFGRAFGPIASNRNDQLAAFLTQLRQRLETHAARVWNAAEESIRAITTKADGLARADKLPGGCIWWDKTPTANRMQFILPTQWQMGMGPVAYHAVVVDQLWSPPEAAVVTIRGKKYVVFGREVRAWVSSGYAAVQGEALAKIMADEDRRNQLAAEEADRRRAADTQPYLTPEQRREKARDEEIAKLKEQVQRLAETAAAK